MATRTGLIPHLYVKGAAAAIEFYKAALGAVELGRMPEMGGGDRIMHAELRIGDSLLMLSDDFPEHHDGVVHAPSGPSPVTLHLCVADCDATMAQAVGAGGTLTMPADDMFWGDRYGKVTDPFGHAWSFSTPLSAERLAEAQKKWEAWQAQQQPAAA